MLSSAFSKIQRTSEFGVRILVLICGISLLAWSVMMFDHLWTMIYWSHMSHESHALWTMTHRGRPTTYAVGYLTQIPSLFDSRQHLETARQLLRLWGHSKHNLSCYGYFITSDSTYCYSRLVSDCWPRPRCLPSSESLSLKGRSLLKGRSRSPFQRSSFHCCRIFLFWGLPVFTQQT